VCAINAGIGAIKFVAAPPRAGIVAGDRWLIW